MPLTKKVFITGGTSGLGAALARYYDSHGYMVGVCGRDESRFKSEFPSSSAIKFYRADVSNRKEIFDVIKEFSVGGLDLVIANAGFSHSRKTKVPNFDESEAIIQVNLLGTLYTFEAALESMLKKQQGHLVAISSVAGFNGMPGTSAYSAAKSGVMKLTESYSIDLAQKGIDVTCVCPGWIKTPLADKNSHPMPFSVDVDYAVKKIVHAIKKKKKRVVFPFIMHLVVRFFSILPRGLFRGIMRLPFVNFSEEN
jgi:short-subunit dehydrogenase